ncbi:MAG: hypothetical protein KC713_05345 [Candidatus Omnitrophica bacterium]|nr:hypothetical protein [Candidatus Omnitrophota bacterium]
MEICPYCGQTIPEGGHKNPSQLKWYFKTSNIVIGFLFVGPLVLPLIWFHPGYKLRTKILATIAISVVSLFFINVTISAFKTLSRYYGLIFDQALN